MEQYVAKLGSRVEALRVPHGVVDVEPRGRNSGVECQLPKLDVAGSNPVARSAASLRAPRWLASRPRRLHIYMFGTFGPR